MTKPTSPDRPKATNITDPELRSMARIVKELQPFDRHSRARIIQWVAAKMDDRPRDADGPTAPDAVTGDSFDTDY